ncbi:MAG: hypothetical protein KJZ80_18650 [Hyphomicrobiaceae bacterium]|nr:hypothetical protein [Hyphomicrobiaceae bacterium]
MTAQMPEIIVLDGTEHALTSLPLEPLLDSMDPRPDIGEWVDFGTTALWRGYVGHWEIAAGSLYLTRLGTSEPDVDLDLDRLLPGRAPPVLASWFSGKLVVPQGDMLLYVHMGWGSCFARETILHVRHGHVWKRRDVDHTERFLAMVDGSRHLLSDGVIPGRGHNIPCLSWLTDEGRALVRDRLGL